MFEQEVLSKQAPLTEPILPGAMIGILGGGQLGRMLALEARAMGYRVAVYTQSQGSPAGMVADVEFTGDYEDLATLHEFAQLCDIVTYEFENVPATTASACEAITPLRPGRKPLAVSQHRITEKQTLSALGLPLLPFAEINAAFDASSPILQNTIFFPGILKSAQTGYDGKGQVPVATADELLMAWDSLGHVDAVLEAYCSFEREVSVVGARSLSGEFVNYGVFENVHENHILTMTSGGFADSAETTRLIDLTEQVFAALDLIGTACVEYFVLPDGEVLINEIAPRPHNSGHLTIEACATSQFGQQLRAICGLPLGSTAYRRPAVMVNLLGDLWENGEPNWSAVLALPEVHLHLYGKAEPRIGRKMGHLTVLAQENESKHALQNRAIQARSLLTQPTKGWKSNAS